MSREVSVGRLRLAGDMVQIQAHQLDSLLHLVRACAESPSWPAEAWKSFVLPEDEGLSVRRAIFAQRRESGGFSGLIAVALTETTTELELLLVHPDLRRGGLGRELTRYWLQWAEEAGAQEAVLEVRASNLHAQQLYRTLGFLEEGWRARYYQQPSEDALLMRRVLGQ